MKKLFRRLSTILVYALTFMTPAFIVQLYSRFVDPMTKDEARMATIAGTAAMLLLAALTGFSGKRPPINSMIRKFKDVKAVGPDSIVVTDPASKAETLFKWNEKEKIWESEYGTYLDQDHMEEWLRQRASDRQWAEQQRKKLQSRDTAFDRDIDAMGRKRR